MTKSILAPAPLAGAESRVLDHEDKVTRETDSLLEGDGFELPVPRQIVSGSAPVRPNGVGSTGPTQGRPAGIVDLGRTSDHQLASDTAYIHLEIEPLHRRAREMPRQTARDGSAADELVGHEEMDVKDRIDLGCGHIRPALQKESALALSANLTTRCGEPR